MKYQHPELAIKEMLNELGISSEYIHNIANDDEDGRIDCVEINDGMGAIQISWVADGHNRTTMDEGAFEVAYRQWDRTHGLSVERIEAHCSQPATAVAVVK